MSPRKQANWCRFWIVVLSLIAIIVAGWGGTSINPIILWMMSFTVPLFFIWYFGMFWRRSTTGAVITLLLCWVVNCALTIFGLAVYFHLEGNNYSIFMMVLSVVVYLVAASLDRNARPAYKKIYQEQHAAFIAGQKMRGAPGASTSAAPNL